MKQSQKDRKDFEAAWVAAGLRPFGRLNPTLQGLLSNLLLDNEWSSKWREALARAGQIPFLAIGAGRTSGPLDPFEFLGSHDFAMRVLRGKFDPREKTAPANGKPLSTDPFADLEAKFAAEGAAS